MVTRRAVLGGLLGGAALAGCRPAAPLGITADEPAPDAPEFAPPLPTDDVTAHLARRLTYGVTPDVLRDIEAAGSHEAWIDAQLAPDLADDDPDLLTALDALTTLRQDGAELLSYADRDRERRRPALELQVATLLRAVHSRWQLHELLVMFWSDHLSIFIGDGPVSFLKTLDDREVVRRHALDRFDEMLVASAKSPAMLLYLDNAKSRGDDPNENYARELLELHTVGVDGGYDEDDIAAAARVLSGWTLERRTAGFRFLPRWHADGPAEVLDWSTDGTGGVGDGEDLLRYLAHHPATARRLARKLALRFVSDAPSDDLVDAVATAYLDNDTAIVPTVRTLLTSDEFAASAGRKLRRPYELLVASLRGLGTPVPDVRDERSIGLLLRGVARHLETLGHVPFTWPAPNGFPDVAPAWLSAGSVLARWNLVQALTGTGTGDGPPLDAPLLTAGLATDDIATQLGIGPLSADTRDIVEAHVATTSADPTATTVALLLDSRPFQYR